MELTFKLTKEEAQQVLDVLVKEPYVTVFNVVNKIQAQANEQMKEKGVVKEEQTK